MGVWIETDLQRYYCRETDVTPCMGVWIETFVTLTYDELHLSHPVWVCGLKQSTRLTLMRVTDVTPCMGVWIETLLGSHKAQQARSHPVWVCGLKLREQDD